MRKLLIALGLLLGGWVAGILTERVSSHRLTSGLSFVQQPLPSSKPIEETILAPRKESRVRVSSESIKADLLAALQETEYNAQNRAIFTALHEAQLEDIPSLLEFAKTLPGYKSRGMTLSVVGRWAELDSPAAAAFTQSIRREDRPQAMKVVGKEWAKRDSAAAKGWTASLPVGSEQNAAAIGVVSNLAKENPASALSWIRQFVGAQRSYDAYSEIFRVWATQDCATAAREVLALPPSAARSNAIYTTGEKWAEKDPQAAFAWANNVPDPIRRTQLMEFGLRQWALRDAATATTTVLNLPSGEARNGAISALACGLAGSDLETAKKLIEQLPAGGARISAMSALISSLAYASQDPKPAIEYALTLPPGDARNGLLSQMVDFGELFNEPEQSLSYLSERLSGDAAGRQLIGRTLQGWADNDPGAAVNWAMKADPGAVDEKSLHDAGFRWAHMDAEDALAWTGSQSEGPRKAALLAGVITGIAQSEAPRAAELFSSLPPGPQQNDAAGVIAGQWVRRDPNAAASWTTKLPEGDARNSAVRQLVSNWAEYDVMAAAKWVEGLAVGGTRDAAAAAYANKVIATDPEGAAAWSASIVDASQRENALRRTFEKWKIQDEAAAKRWVEATPALDQEAKQRLLAK